MKKLSLWVFTFLFIGFSAIAQETKKDTKKTQQGHTDQNKFRQMKDVLATPNEQHAASGAPGYEYTQQKVDYEINVRLNEDANRISGDEKITYHNNSKDALEYLWVQLDQNMRADDSKTPLVKSASASAFLTPKNFKKTYMKEKSGFGFNIEAVKANGKSLSYLINR
ncbi:MAG: M1 family peptidase, partial [Polaribacter sp.]